jgi:predicted metalloprotease with PDZ domain
MQVTHYRITPLDPKAHLFEVRCTVDDPDPAGQRFRLPAWIPGSYLIREFARQFIDASLMRCAPGQVISIHAFRRDELLHVEAELASAPLDTCYLSARTDATEATRALRDGWLAGA